MYTHGPSPQAPTLHRSSASRREHHGGARPVSAVAITLGFVSIYFSFLLPGASIALEIANDVFGHTLASTLYVCFWFNAIFFSFHLCAHFCGLLFPRHRTCFSVVAAVFGVIGCTYFHLWVIAHHGDASIRPPVEFFILLACVGCGVR